jgi:predicted dehydrogenase
MGANHARVVAESGSAELALVVDTDQQRAQELAGRHGAFASADLDGVTACDAAIIAATTRAHAAIAIPLLEAGVPVLVEKPLAPELDEVVSIIEASKRGNAPIACGFVERHNPALSTVLERLEEPVIHVNSIRHSPQNPVATATVGQDLLIHDVDLAVRLSAAGALPAVHGGVWAPKVGSQSEIAECVLVFDDGMLANLSASRWGQRKIREISIATEQQLFEIDLLRVSVTVYRNVSQSAIFGDHRDYRSETIIDVPYVRHRGEPLALQLQAFIDLVTDGDGDAIAKARDGILPSHEIVANLETMGTQ